MTTRYRINASQSRMTAQAFSAGLLSLIGHDPTFPITSFEGDVAFEEDMIARMKLNLLVRAGSLTLPGAVASAIRQGQDRANAPNTQAFHDVSYRAEAVSSERVETGRYRVTVEGPFAVKGVQRTHELTFDLAVFSDGVRLRGRTTLHLSHYQLQGLSAAGGAIRLKDEVVLSFDLLGEPDGS